MPTAAILAGRADRRDGRDKGTLGGYHPLCPAASRACLPAVARRLADRRLTLTGLREEVRARELTAEGIDAFGDCHRLLANVNPPADYEEFEGLQGH